MVWMYSSMSERKRLAFRARMILAGVEDAHYAKSVLALFYSVRREDVKIALRS